MQLVDISDGFLSLMDGGGNLREDLRLPSGVLGQQIGTGMEQGGVVIITILSALDCEAIIAAKRVPE